MTLNNTIADLTQEQVISVSHKAVIQNTLFLWISTILIFLLIGMIAIKTKGGRSKYFWVWFGSSILTCFVVGIIIFRPDWIVSLFDLISS